MFALSYLLSLLKVGTLKPTMEESPTSSKSMQNDDKDKIKLQTKTFEERELCAATRAVVDFMTDSEESGLEYESATDHEHDYDTLVNSDASGDVFEDILDTSLLQLKIQVNKYFLNF